jgi:hypothetical protein
MAYSLFADLVLILHATFIIFVVLGGVAVLWRRGLVWLHAPCALWGILIGYLGWICPLTYLENGLRSAAGSRGYTGGFIEHYMIPLVYPSGLNSEMQMLLGTAVLSINIILYMLVWRRWNHHH